LDSTNLSLLPSKKVFVLTVSHRILKVKDRIQPQNISCGFLVENMFLSLSLSFHQRSVHLHLPITGTTWPQQMRASLNDTDTSLRYAVIRLPTADRKRSRMTNTATMPKPQFPLFPLFP